MKTLKIIGGTVIVLVLIIIVVGLVSPSQVEISRSTTITAPPRVVYSQVADLKAWKTWSPWAEIDPSEYEDDANYSGAPGAGQEYRWNSEVEDMGKGSLRIDEAVPNQSLQTTLKFEGMGESHGSWSFEETKDGNTTVTWTMRSDMSNPPVIGPLFGYMMDGMVGPDFEEGLEQLKTVAEEKAKDPKAVYGIDISEEMVDPVQILYIRDTTTTNSEDIGASIGASYSRLGTFVGKNQMEMTGAPSAINHKWDEQENVYIFDAAFPVAIEDAEKLKLSDNIQFGETYGGKVLKAVHIGPYEESPKTYMAIEAYIKDHGYAISGPSWEVYVDDPTQVAAEDLRTEIYFPIQ